MSTAWKERVSAKNARVCCRLSFAELLAKKLLWLWATWSASDERIAS